MKFICNFQLEQVPLEIALDNEAVLSDKGFSNLFECDDTMGKCWLNGKEITRSLFEFAATLIFPIMWREGKVVRKYRYNAGGDLIHFAEVQGEDFHLFVCQHGDTNAITVCTPSDFRKMWGE